MLASPFHFPTRKSSFFIASRLAAPGCWATAEVAKNKSNDSASHLIGTPGEASQVFGRL